MKSLFEKFKFRQVPVTESHSRIWYANYVFSDYTSLLPNVEEVWSVNNGKIKKDLPKRDRLNLDD